MTLKQEALVGTLMLATAFALGRYSTPVKTITETKTAETEKKSDKEKTDLNKDKRVKTVTTETVRPDGTKEKRTETTEETTTSKKTASSTTDQLAKTEQTSKETVRGSQPVTISALGGVDFSTPKMTYGAAITKPVLGPITIGVWGLSSGVGGASVGLTF